MSDYRRPDSYNVTQSWQDSSPDTVYDWSPGAWEVGCDLYLARYFRPPHTKCGKQLLSTHYRNLFSTVLATNVHAIGVFSWLVIRCNKYWPHNRVFLFPPVCPVTWYRKSQVSSPRLYILFPTGCNNPAVSAMCYIISLSVLAAARCGQSGCYRTNVVFLQCNRLSRHRYWISGTIWTCGSWRRRRRRRYGCSSNSYIQTLLHILGKQSSEAKETDKLRFLKPGILVIRENEIQ